MLKWAVVLYIRPEHLTTPLSLATTLATIPGHLEHLPTGVKVGYLNLIRDQTGSIPIFK